MSLYDHITKQLKADEGQRPVIYRDSLGFWTIGCGRLVDPAKAGAGLRQSEIDFMLQNDVNDKLSELMRKFPWFNKLNEARQGVLLNMCFNLGLDGLCKFKLMLLAIERGAWSEAVAQMKDSVWARQVPNRAERLMRQMESGEWVFQE